MYLINYFGIYNAIATAQTDHVRKKKELLRVTEASIVRRMRWIEAFGHYVKFFVHICSIEIMNKD